MNTPQHASDDTINELFELLPEVPDPFDRRHKQRTAFRVVVPSCEHCGAGADEPCGPECPHPVKFPAP